MELADTIYTTYDNADKVIKIERNPRALETPALTIIDSFVYDQYGRNTQIHQKIGNNGYQHLTSYSFDAADKMTAKDLHNTGTGFLENTTIRPIMSKVG